MNFIPLSSAISDPEAMPSELPKFARCELPSTGPCAVLSNPAGCRRCDVFPKVGVRLETQRVYSNWPMLETGQIMASSHQVTLGSSCCCKYGQMGLDSGFAMIIAFALLI